MDGHLLAQVPENPTLRIMPLSIQPTKTVSVQGVENAAILEKRQTASRHLLAQLDRDDRMRRRHSLLFPQVSDGSSIREGRCLRRRLLCGLWNFHDLGSYLFCGISCPYL